MICGDVMIGYIYITTNLVTWMQYIGKHKSHEYHRWYLGSGSILKSEIRKYGKENFISVIIETCDSVDDLNERERFWISHYDAVNSRRFYNIADGGAGSSGDGFCEAMKIAWSRSDYRESHIDGALKHWSDPDRRSEHIESIRNADHQSVWTDELRGKQRERQLESWSNPELKKRHSEAMKSLWSEDKRNAARDRNSHDRNPSFGKHYYVNGDNDWIFCRPESVPAGYHLAKFCWISKDGTKVRHEKGKPIPDGWKIVKRKRSG